MTIDPAPISSSRPLDDPPDFWYLTNGRDVDSDASSRASSNIGTDFKQAVRKLYNCLPKEDDNCLPKEGEQIRCMLLNKWCDKRDVKLAHIVPKRKCVGDEVYLDLPPMSQLAHDPYNFLVLSSPVEEAFDNRQACFVQDFKRRFIFHLLDKSTASKPVGRTTLGKLHGRKLKLPKNVQPYARLLGHHALCTFRNAHSQGWINDEEFQTIEDYHRLSPRRPRNPTPAYFRRQTQSYTPQATKRSGSSMSSRDSLTSAPKRIKNNDPRYSL